VSILHDAATADVDTLHEHCEQRGHEEKEEAMVQATNTVVRPDTVVIKPVYTPVTHTWLGNNVQI